MSESEIEAGDAHRARAGSPIGEFVLGGLIVALGLVLFWQLTQITVGPSYARIGPRLFPGLVATGLIAIGAGIILGALRGRDIQPPDAFDLSPVLWIAAGLLVLIGLIEPAGFIPAATLLFTFVARGFGSRTVVRDMLIGLAVALVCQFGFVYGLGLELPWGILSIFR